ncbi:MAG: AAA family ATPase [Candidatus Glassbacteria bacterium]|nr:AAA family ATPase [Candidatus Glassbacteria bacterium]
MNSQQLLDKLNPPQREAITHGEGPLLVLAGAGSGKTRVLTFRIAWLVGELGVPPSDILALTFTNKAAGEMKARVENLIGQGTSLWIGTFHSIFARILRRDAQLLGYNQNYTIYDADDSERVVKNILKELPDSFQNLKPRQLRHKISRWKNDLRIPEDVKKGGGNPADSRTAEIYERYEHALKENNAMDFDDLIIRPAELFAKAPEVLERYRRKFRHILIDEFQDTNRAQYNLVRMLAGSPANLCVVGDDDQSIYGWRGAEIRNILDFAEHFPGTTVVRLEQNYRSSGNILEVANAVVVRNRGRKPKKLWTEKSAGDKAVVLECENELDEADQVVSHSRRATEELGLAWRELAVLYRTNAQSRVLEEAFNRNGVKVVIIGGLRFYERKEIKDLMAYLKVIVNPRDSTSLYRIINVPARGIGPATLSRLTRLAVELGEPLYHVLGEADRAEGVGGKVAGTVMELHTMFEDLRTASRTESATAVLQELIRRSGYNDSMAELDTIEAQGRMENIQELVNAAEEYSERFSGEEGVSCLEGWLAETSLVSEIDFHDPDQDCLTLMTLHNAKGLEFPAVFITGVEEDLLPISRAWEDDDGEAVEEERRLFYVGITRAMKRVYLSWASTRRRYGVITGSGPSMFLRDIPDELVEKVPSLRRRAGSFGAYARRQAETFGRGGRGRSPIGPQPPIFAAPRGDGPVNGEQPQSAGEPVFVPDPGVDEPNYRKGERVVHGTFGSGTIQEVTESLGDIRVTVRFDSGFSKKLVPRFARLLRE